MDRGTLLAQLEAMLTSRGEVLEAYLFGSRARDTAAAHSDIDVAVYVDPDGLRAREASEPFGYQAELTTALMRALGTNDVDVVLLNRAAPMIYHRVLSDGVRLLARKLAATTTREGRALSRWCDWVPQLAKIDSAVRGRRAR
jgi:hypothetical protein